MPMLVYAHRLVLALASWSPWSPLWRFLWPWLALALVAGPGLALVAPVASWLALAGPCDPWSDPGPGPFAGPGQSRPNRPTPGAPSCACR